MLLWPWYRNAGHRLPMGMARLIWISWCFVGVPVYTQDNFGWLNLELKNPNVSWKKC